MKRFFYLLLLALFSVSAGQAQIVEVTGSSREIVADAEGIGPASPREVSTQLGMFNRAVFDNASSGTSAASAGQNSEISANAGGILVTDSSGAHAAGGATDPTGADSRNLLTLNFSLTVPIVFSLEVTTSIQDGSPTAGMHDQASYVRLFRDGVLLYGFGGNSTTLIGPRSGSASGTLLPGNYSFALETFVHNAGDATREVRLLVGTIPEPATAGLLVTGLLGVSGRRRVRNSRRTAIQSIL